MIKRLFILISFVYSGAMVSYAQSPKLRTTTTLNAPYSPYIKDYVNSPNNAISLYIECIDISSPPVKTTFRLIMENTTGLRIETKTSATLPIWVVTPDRPLLLQGRDLLRYFEADNLTFMGISAADYRNEKPVPGGLYTIRFQAYDANTGKLISENVSAQAWFILNKVPLIVQPKDNEELYLGENERFYFEWLSRNDKASDVSRIEYHFQMAEIPLNFQGQVAPIFQSLPVVYTKVTTSTSLLIDFTQTPLESGRRYAFRIQAKAFTEGYESKIFENQGCSPIYVFTYKGACTAPSITGIDFPNSHTAEIKWKHNPEANRYIILYRDVEAKNWERKDVSTLYLRVSGLQYDRVYEYKIRSYCKNCPSGYSDTYTFSLPTDNKPIMRHSHIALTEKTLITYNPSDTTVTIVDKHAGDSIRIDVREIVLHDKPVSITDDFGALLTLTPNRLK
jgi:hypothetical protein